MPGYNVASVLLGLHVRFSLVHPLPGLIGVGRARLLVFVTCYGDDFLFPLLLISPPSFSFPWSAIREKREPGWDEGHFFILVKFSYRVINA